MRTTSFGSALALLLVVLPPAAWAQAPTAPATSPAASAQTADEVIERSITALGGRAAHAKIKSRVTTGAITFSTPGGNFDGSLEVYNAAPNKVRTVIKADLSAVGVGQLLIDQRFDGQSGYVLDSLQGNRDITGNQLDNMRSGGFPHPFLNYKDLGTSAKMVGKEKVGDRDAYVILFDPTSGSTIRQYIDAETYLPTKVVMTVAVPEMGGDMEQTTEFTDYREVDGIKTPFRLNVSSTVQSFEVKVDKVEHNVSVETALFSKPGA